MALRKPRVGAESVSVVPDFTSVFAAPYLKTPYFVPQIVTIHTAALTKSYVTTY